MTTAICPGSFDPITLGHVDIICRAAEIFDEVVVCVMHNAAKKSPMFTLEEKLSMARRAVEGYKNVRVDSYDGLLTEYVRRFEKPVVVKGLRAGFLSLAKIQPRLGLEWDEVHCVKNRYPIYYGFPLAQELVIRIIQQNRRQAGYFMVQWQWRKYRIIRKNDCISATGKQLYHVGIIPARYV